MDDSGCNNSTPLRLSCLLLLPIPPKPPFSVSSGHDFSAFHSPRPPGSLAEGESLHLLHLSWFLRRRLKMFKQRDSNIKLRGYGEKSTDQHMEIQTVEVQVESASRAMACREEVKPQGSSEEDYSIANECHASEIKPFAAREFQVFWEPLRAGSSTFADVMKRSLIDKNGSVSVLKPSIYKDRSNGFVTPISVKRKISWQDQLSLKV